MSDETVPSGVLGGPGVGSGHPGVPQSDSRALRAAEGGWRFWLDAQPIINDPAMLATVYGVPISTVGEEGDWMALGHVSERSMVAAMRKCGRDDLRWRDDETFGEGWSSVDDILAAVERRRVVFTTSPDGWMAWWTTEAQTHPRAIDVTMWSA